MIFGTATRKLSMNLADIPISLNLFMDFYTENVVKQGKVRWPIMRFIKKVATDLIFAALGGNCYENPVSTMTRGPTRLGIDIISFPKDVMAAPSRQNISSLNLLKVNGNWSSSVKASSIYEYVVLHANFFPATSRVGNRAEDAKSGIYHLELGRDVGMVKEVQLSKENKPMLVSDRLDRSGKINRIAHPYHADIKMVGNTFFRPGARVFVNPSMTSIGSATHRHSIVSRLGIGGYYVVMGVSGHLEAGKYETTLRAKWDANGFPTTKKTATKFVESTITVLPFASIPASAIADGHTAKIAASAPAEDKDKQSTIRKGNIAGAADTATVIPEVDSNEYQRLSFILKEYQEIKQNPFELIPVFRERQRVWLVSRGLHSLHEDVPSGGIRAEFIDITEGTKIYKASE